MPDNLKEAMDLATYIAGSSLVPKAYQNKPADIFVAAKFGQALGLSIMQSVLAMAVINGRPGIFGDDMLAVVQAHPAYEGHKEFWEGEGDNLVAVCQIKRRGQDMHESRFSVADAKQAGLWDTRERIQSRDGGDMRNPAPWHCYPKRMLMMRARGFGLRDKFADALRGMKSVEELQDYPVIEGSFDATPASSPSTSTAEASGSQSTGGNADDKAAAEVRKKEAASFAAEWLNTAKDAGRTSAECRAYLKDALKVETSLDIPPASRADALAWAKEKAKPAAEGKHATKAESTPANNASPFAQQFEILDWNPKEREDYLLKMAKFSETQIRADLNRIIEERDSKERGK
jgi:hypothetical protein